MHLAALSAAMLGRHREWEAWLSIARAHRPARAIWQGQSSWTGIRFPFERLLRSGCSRSSPSGIRSVSASKPTFSSAHSTATSVGCTKDSRHLCCHDAVKRCERPLPSSATGSKRPIAEVQLTEELTPTKVAKLGHTASLTPMQAGPSQPAASLSTSANEAAHVKRLSTPRWTARCRRWCKPWSRPLAWLARMTMGGRVWTAYSNCKATQQQRRL